MVKNQRGNYQDAINYIEKALSINPNFDFVYNNLGNIFFRTINFEKAYFNKTEVLRKLILYKEALEAYNDYLKINAKLIPTQWFQVV